MMDITVSPMTGEPRKLGVSTSRTFDPKIRAKARKLASELGIPMIPRRGRSVARILAEERLDGLITVTAVRTGLHVRGSEFFFHPNMAKTRIKGLQKGGRDVMVDAMGLCPGMTVLDATVGLASDAIVAAYAVGPSGRVLGIDVEPLVVAIVRIGLQEFDMDNREVAAAMRAVNLMCAEHLEFLRQCADDEYDVVYFDPFFCWPIAGSAGIEPLRAIAVLDDVRPEAIAEAVRVARRRVVIKRRLDEAGPPPEGWQWVSGRKQRVGYWVLEA